MSEKDAEIARAQAVREACAVELMGKANVVGVGFRRRGGRQEQQVALVVMVRRKLPRAMLAEADVLPGVIDGIPVDVLEVGDISAG